jgi:hypothetical protein
LITYTRLVPDTVSTAAAGTSSAAADSGRTASTCQHLFGGRSQVIGRAGCIANVLDAGASQVSRPLSLAVPARESLGALIVQPRFAGQIAAARPAASISGAHTDGQCNTCRTGADVLLWERTNLLRGTSWRYFHWPASICDIAIVHPCRGQPGALQFGLLG